ncbi:carboxylesterase 5A [Bradysia coprophila]|uniref:carboxylesterase 5A n=1 Tax=Bradysia coprophila TaxID=38358 RepID=UPI00187D9349|nr:carboxylesterase 5A [Bradysia coprophila]
MQRGIMHNLLQFICVLLIIISNVSTKRVKRIVGGVTSSPPLPDDPVVFTKLYSRSARVEGFRNPVTGLYSFLALRYAEPPVGENRFLRPKYQRLEGDINATMYGPPCPQPDPRRRGYIIGNEDCLLLNVFTPQMPDETTGLPVLVFIHGGGFRFGSANQYGPDPLTSKKMIFVPIQYRLGTLGIIGDGTTEFSGNVALFDMNAAIRWVKEYISFFGGDPKQITIIGHGSGAVSATHLSMSPISRELVSGVVAMSGSAFTKNMIDDSPVQSVRQIAEFNQCGSARNETEILKCLRERDVIDIVNQDSKVQTERLHGQALLKAMTGAAGFGLVVEKPYDNRGLPSILDGLPEMKLKSGLIKQIPLLTGVTKHETANGFLLNQVRDNFLSATEFLKVISGGLNLDKILPANLPKINLPGSGNVLQLADYLKIPETLDPVKIVAKLTEATTDMLFNLPAFLTVQEWSKFAPSFLYSFEYSGRNAKGSAFLNGLPVVAGNNSIGDEPAVSHGDDLAYLFDVRDLDGNPINEEPLHAADKEVRNSFTDLLSNFVRSGANKDKNENSGLFSLFQSGGDSFIKIGKEVTLEKDFRICQLSLFGATTKSIGAAACTLLVDELSALNQATTNVTKELTKTLGLDGKSSVLNLLAPPKSQGTRPNSLLKF